MHIGRACQGVIPIRILFADHLKHSSFWPLADVKLMSNDLVHAMTRQCMFALFMRITLN